MDNELTYETIERYLAGDLKGEELTDFEARLAQEPELLNELELHRGLASALGDAGAMNFFQAVEEAQKNYLAETEKTSESDTPPSAAVRPLWRRSYSIAAAVLLLFIVGIFFLRQMGSESAGELYGEYFSVYESPTEWRGSDPVLDADLKSAFEAYNAKNFDAAMKAFESIEARDSANVTARFYLGMCALAKGDAGAAIPRLQSLADESGHSYRSQSRWYLALAWLKQDKVENAKPLLETLAKGNGKYATLARELLAKL